MVIKATIQIVRVLVLTVAKVYVHGVSALGITIIKFAALLTVFHLDGLVSSICGHDNAPLMN
jgi:hypothetical protein